MGCACSNRASQIYATSVKEKTHKSEIDEIAELPVRGKTDEEDLLTFVELSVKCTDLSVIDRFTSINPVVYFLIEEDSIFQFKDQTEVQEKTTSPSFITPFRLAYSFEKQLRFKLDVYDNKLLIDGKPTKNSLIGTNVFNVHEIVCSPGHTLTKPLLNPLNKKKDLGTFTVHSEEIQESTREVEMVCGLFSGKSKISCIFKILKQSQDDFMPIYQSENVTYEKNQVIWKKFKIASSRFCGNDENKIVRIEVFQVTQELKLMGSCETSLKKLNEKCFEYVLMKGGKVIDLKFMVHHFSLNERHTFLEYVRGGCEISMMIAIDFTKSNGDPALETSLHYLDKEKPNEYIQAIRAVGEILQYYDSDKKIPVYGFGAKIPPSFSIISHCFAVNNNIFDPEVQGIEEVITSYADVIPKLQLYGPTHFSEVIHTSIEYAESAKVNQEKQQYFILLILTDGIINDLDETIDELVVACDLPISIIIVGVGNEDFSMMKFLDADENPLFSKTYQAAPSRDIVQFVPFRDFKQKSYALAREVLQEIPQQVTEFMKIKKIVPKVNKETQVKRFLSRRFSSPLNSNGSNSVKLGKDKTEFIEEIVRMGFNRNFVEGLVNSGIYCKDPQHILDIIQSKKNDAKPPKSILKQPSLNFKTVIVKEAKKKNFCFMCQVQPIDVILKDCGCEVVCSKCIQMIARDCPQCNGPIVKWVKKPAGDRITRHRVSLS
jgi:vacuolar-type H+-ATPase subunit F/Vma7